MPVKKLTAGEVTIPRPLFTSKRIDFRTFLVYKPFRSLSVLSFLPKAIESIIQKYLFYLITRHEDIIMFHYELDGEHCSINVAS